ncbi:MAG: tetraacyldisaccharide 4'-kinase [Planctomycetota bacterium]
MNGTDRTTSLLPVGLRWAGPLLAAGYGLGSRLDRALATPRFPPVPAICIGNITVGGTGKTPATKYFARGLAARGRKPAVLLRGYKGQARDEAVELQSALGELQVPVLIGADRRAAAGRAKEQGCDAVLLDDGFQHWRLARDLDIVLVDATDPFGGGHLAPWGRLRERPEALARAGVVIITRADMIPAADLAALEQTVARYAPKAVLAKARHKPVALRELTGDKTLSLEELKKNRVYALCGLGNPQAFLDTLSKLETQLVGNACYPDHVEHEAWTSDFIDIPNAEALGAQAIVVTEKDAAKLVQHLAGVTFPFWVLTIQFEILDGEEAVWAKVVEALDTADKRVGR